MHIFAGSSRAKRRHPARCLRLAAITSGVRPVGPIPRPRSCDVMYRLTLPTLSPLMAVMMLTQSATVPPFEVTWIATPVVVRTSPCSLHFSVARGSLL
jgi:hypothetical protein